MVAIIVDSKGSAKTFTVHQDLLCYYSEQFRHMIHVERREIEDKTIRIQHVGEDVFSIVCHWLYAQSSRVDGPASLTLEDALDGHGRDKHQTH